MTCNRLLILKSTEKLILGNPRISLLEISENILIKQLAAELGYGSARAFSRAFREHVNTSPGRYRRHPHPVPAPPKLENLPEMSSFPPQM